MVQGILYKYKEGIMFVHKKGTIKYKVDMFKDNETNQFVGIVQGLGYSGYGSTIDEAIKNTDTSVEMALEWHIENGSFEQFLSECGYELVIEDNQKFWKLNNYVGNFESSVAA